MNLLPCVFCPIRAKAQTGWIMVEMVLCLALLAVVLHLTQRQLASLWQAQQVAQQQGYDAENRHKQMQMLRLTGSDSWLHEQANSQTTYPHCQLCSADDLRKWFAAIQSTGLNRRDK